VKHHAKLASASLEEVRLDDGIQVGGLLHQLHDFGPTSRDADVFFPDGTSLPSDGIATGQITSTADGVTHWVGAEAPAGNAALPEDPIGGRSQLRQTQSFHKLSPDASLSFTVSAAFIETTDRNAALARRRVVLRPVKGELFLDVQAFTVPAAPDIIPFDTFFHVAGGATVSGFALNWNSDAWTTHYSQLPLWNIEDFDFVINDLDGAAEGLVLMILRQPRTFTIDLSSVDVGQPFTLQASAMATAHNRIAGPPSEFESSATAFLRDPQGIDGRTFSGLEPIDAVAGTDYTPVHASVFFADGDDTPRAVEIPVLPNQLGGEGYRTLTITLTEPGGCAMLGSPATAELTIRDSNPAPPPTQPFGLDPTFGTGAKATTTAFGGDRSSMALQSDGKIVLVGGTFTAFVLARLLADGTLDTEFTDTGVMTIDFFGFTDLAESVAVTDDGKILVAGQARDNVDGYGVARVSRQDTGPTGS
jgi:hypothetical protein